MSSQKVPTARQVDLIDIDDEEPERGELVLALTEGGILVKEIWTSDSKKYFLAWCKHPIIPKSIRDKLRKRRTGL